MDIKNYQYIKNGNISIYCSKNNNSINHPYKINLKFKDMQKKYN